MTTTHKISQADRIYRGSEINYARGLPDGRGFEIPPIIWHDFGAPATAAADGIAESQTPAAGGIQELTLDGVTVSDGVAVLDVPRNVTVTSAGDDSGRTFTITGTDVDGKPMVEAITGANAGAASGKKAFKTVTKAETDDDTADAVTVGFGDVLGLPYRIDVANQIISSRMDGAADAVSIVVADDDPATATTGDVRGTVDFNTASNGTRRFGVQMLLTPGTVESLFGVAQFAG